MSDFLFGELTAQIADAEMRRMSDEELFEQRVSVNAPSFEGAFIVPPVERIFAVRVTLQILLVNVFSLEVEGVSL